MVPTHRQTIAALTFLTLCAGAARGDDGAAPLDTTDDRIEGWPIMGVTDLAGYDRIETVSPIVPRTVQDKDAEQDEAAPSKEIDADKQRRRRLWQKAKPKAKRVLLLLRPDLAEWVGHMELDESTESGVLRVIHGQSSQPPYLEMEFAVDNKEPRLIHVHLYAQATGREAAATDQRRWQRYAETTLRQVFGRQPRGKLRVRSMANGFYFDWVPHWSKQLLPREYWTSFGAVQSDKGWVHAWTARKTPAAIKEAIERLDLYPVDHDLLHGVMVVVKNALALLPGQVPPLSKVWAQCEAVGKGPYGRGPIKPLHIDKPAILAQQQRSQPALAWYVRIIPRGDDRTWIIGWVDPATGVLLHLGTHRPPK